MQVLVSAIFFLLWWQFAACPAQARKLTDVFQEELGGLELEPIGKALAGTVASTYPVASASSSVVYQYDPQLEAFERRTRVLGPIIGERAETIGIGEMDVSLTYSYVDLDTINGQSLSRLHNKASIGDRVVTRNLDGFIELADGRVTNFLPVEVNAALDVDANIVTPGFTYGFTKNFDLNITLPLIRTSLDADVTEVRPDPRHPQFQPKEPGDPAGIFTTTTSDSSFGVGDLLFRGKYIFNRGAPLDVGMQLGLSLPTGDEEDLQGTGTTRVQPLFIASRLFANRIEPLLNLGFDINTDDVDRSVFRWAVGATGQIYGPLTGAVVFLGRNELSAQTEEIETPFFFQIERNDIYDLALGVRFLFWESFILSANALVPLNDDGLRADVIPTAQIEYVFALAN